MPRDRNRDAQRPVIEATEASVVGYVYCGLPDDWDERTLWSRAPVSTRSMNPLYREQRNVIKARCKEHGEVIRQTFCDLRLREEVATPDREGLAKLLAMVRERHGAKVVVDRADRLAADPLTLALLLSYLGSLGLWVIEAPDWVDLTGNADLQTHVNAAGPEALARARKVLSLFKRRVARRVTRRKPGRKPYGTLPQEEGTLRRLLDLRRKLPKDERKRSRGGARLSFARIAEILNGEGKRTRQGKVWSAAAVRNLVQREHPGWLSE